MKVVLEIKKRNKDYGIITWPYSLDFDIKTLFEQKVIIDFQFEKEKLTRKISYKYRKIAFGKTRLKNLEDAKYISLSKENNIIRIKESKSIKG